MCVAQGVSPGTRSTALPSPSAERGGGGGVSADPPAKAGGYSL